MAEFTLTAEQIQDNYLRFRKIINERFPTRKDALNEMYDELNGDDSEQRLLMAPASSRNFFHNAFPGGYVDHVLRVYDFALLQFGIWKKLGFEVDSFTQEEVEFCAFHHDLGKLGLPGLNHENYQPTREKWERDRGIYYTSNPNQPYMKTADVSFYLLNHFSVKYSINEFFGIKLTDGLFDDDNKYYLAGYDLKTKVRNCLPYILHHADIMAYRFEFERWAKSSGKFNLSINSDPIKIKKGSDKNQFNVNELDEFLK